MDICARTNLPRLPADQSGGGAPHVAIGCSYSSMGDVRLVGGEHSKLYSFDITVSAFAAALSVSVVGWGVPSIGAGAATAISGCWPSMMG